MTGPRDIGAVLPDIGAAAQTGGSDVSGTLAAAMPVFAAAVAAVLTNVAVFAGSPAVTPSAAAVASRTTGPAPLGVFLDCTGTTMASVTKPFHHLHYFVDWGDGSTTTGPVAGHVYQAAGSYTITIRVVGPGNASDTVFVMVTVDDPDPTFSGASTVCFSNDGDFTGAPPGATQVTTSSFNTVMSYYGADTRLMLKFGHDFVATSGESITASGNSQITAFGTGTSPDSRGIYSNAPTVTVNHAGDAITVQGGGLTLADLEFVDGGSGNSAVENARQVTNLTVFRCKSTGFARPFEVDHAVVEFFSDPANDAVVVSHCDFSDVGELSVFTGGERFAFLHSRFHSNGSTHTFRSLYCYKFVVDSCDLSGADSSRHLLKMHAQQDLGLYNDSRFIVVRGNRMTVEQNWGAAIGPQNSTLPEDVFDYLVEGNFLDLLQGTQVGFYCNGTNGTLRNNVFQTAAGITGSIDDIRILRRGTETAPSGMEVYHNSHRDTGSSLSAHYAVQALDHTGDVVVKNVVARFDVGTNAITSTSDGTTFDTAANVLNGTEGWADPANDDFSLTAGSTSLIGAGATVPVYADHTSNERTTFDVGAFYYAPTNPAPSFGVTMPVFGATVTAAQVAQASISAAMPVFQATITAETSGGSGNSATLAAQMPVFQAALTAVVQDPAVIQAAMPVFAAAVEAEQGNPAALAAAMPVFEAAVESALANQAGISAGMPVFQAAVTGGPQAGATAGIAAEMPVFGAAVLAAIANHAAIATEMPVFGVQVLTQPQLKQWTGHLGGMQLDALWPFRAIGEDGLWKRAGHEDSPKSIRVRIKRSPREGSPSTAYELHNRLEVSIPNHDSIGVLEIREGDYLTLRVQANQPPRDCRVLRVLSSSALKHRVEVGTP